MRTTHPPFDPELSAVLAVAGRAVATLEPGRDLNAGVGRAALDP